MELAKALNVRKGVTAIIGAGGKTTLLLALARELARTARVIECCAIEELPPEKVALLYAITVEKTRKIYIFLLDSVRRCGML